MSATWGTAGDPRAAFPGEGFSMRGPEGATMGGGVSSRMFGVSGPQGGALPDASGGLLPVELPRCVAGFCTSSLCASRCDLLVQRCPTTVAACCRWSCPCERLHL